MIEKLIIRNELTLKRWRKFKRNRPAVMWTWFLMVLSFFSFTADFWANSKPIVMFYHNRLYLPVVADYHPTEFGREDIVVMDYRSLNMENGDWALWPVIRWDPFESNRSVSNYPSGPSKTNWFGTDDRGRDVFSRLLYGYRYSIVYAVGVWILSYLLGTLIGAGMGYWAGKVDLFGSRLVELIEMMPKLLLLITIIQIFGSSMALLVFFSVIFDWTGIYHQMRSQFLQLRKREYVEAARALGSNHWRILTKHILPNALTPLITFSPFAIAANISGLAVLDYLGLGLQAPTPSWGELVSQAQKYFTTAEWLVWFPSVALLLTMVAFINIGLAIRDAFDAKASVG
jgi:microcin C transport system permease protein